MSSTLVICEKPSQARNLRAALGTSHGQILPAQGHLLRLKEPDETKEEWKEWSTELLHPGRPYDKVPSPDASARTRLKAIREAAAAAKRIVIATDCDREGHLIGQEIVEFCGFRGEVLRAMFNKEDPESLRQAFSRLRPASDYSGLYASGRAREQADQICNLSLTRAATVCLKQPGTKGAIGIGRVKTPTLSIVCRRELEIRDFKPEDYFEIAAETGVAAGSFVMRCAGLPAALRAHAAASDEEEAEATADDAAFAAIETLEGRIRSHSIADRVAAAAGNWAGPLKVDVRDCSQNPPRLYDLTALQAACSARFGWSGDKTLTVAQALYSDRQIITYPRAEGRHLGDNQIGEAGPLSAALVSLPEFAPHAVLVADPVIRKGKSGTFSDKALEGSSHHAIAPNFNMRDSFAEIVPQLTPDEHRLWNLVARSYLAALAPDFLYRQTTIEASIDCAVPVKTAAGRQERSFPWLFRASGRVPTRLGWREILDAGHASHPGNAGKADDGGKAGKPGEDGEDGTDEPDLPAVVNGETGRVDRSWVDTRTTRPPARYTEGTLLKAMKEAWRLVDDPEMRAKLKQTEGIGTPATRSSIVKGLFDQGQLVRKGKQVHPSEAGLELYMLLSRVAPDLTDPARTAAWETLFTRVEDGRMEFMQAVDQICREASRSIARISEAAEQDGMRIAAGKAGKPSPKMLKFAESIAKRTGVALPANVRKDASACKAFLDAHAPKREEGAQGSAPPSDRQMEFARGIARSAGLDLPAEILADSRALSAWIDANKARAVFAPSQKQLDFARRLADEQGLDLSPDISLDAKACSAFIDRHMKNGGGKGRSGGGSRSGTSSRSGTGGKPGASARRPVSA